MLRGEERQDRLTAVAERIDRARSDDMEIEVLSSFENMMTSLNHKVRQRALNYYMEYPEDVNDNVLVSVMEMLMCTTSDCCCIDTSVHFITEKFLECEEALEKSHKLEDLTKVLMMVVDSDDIYNYCECGEMMKSFCLEALTKLCARSKELAFLIWSNPDFLMRCLRKAAEQVTEEEDDLDETKYMDSLYYAVYALEMVVCIAQYEEVKSNLPFIDLLLSILNQALQIPSGFFRGMCQSHIITFMGDASDEVLMYILSSDSFMQEVIDMYSLDHILRLCDLVSSRPSDWFKGWLLQSGLISVLCTERWERGTVRNQSSDNAKRFGNIMNNLLDLEMDDLLELFRTPSVIMRLTMSLHEGDVEMKMTGLEIIMKCILKQQQPWLEYVFTNFFQFMGMIPDFIDLNSASFIEIALRAVSIIIRLETMQHNDMILSFLLDSGLPNSLNNIDSDEHPDVEAVICELDNLVADS